MAAKGDLNAIKFVFSQLPRDLPAEPRRLSYEEYMECMIRTLTQDDLQFIAKIRAELSRYEFTGPPESPEDLEIEARLEFHRNYDLYWEAYNIYVPPHARV